MKRYVWTGVAMVCFMLLGGSAVAGLLTATALEWLTWASISLLIWLAWICLTGLLECIRQLRGR